jgi:2-phospho-L-lactate guanylyltransferase
MCDLQQTCVIIPMKDPHQSKSRLRDAYSKIERLRIALSLFNKTLQFFKVHYPKLNVLVVTPSELVAKTTRQYGHHVLFEQQPVDLNGALDLATQWTLSKGFKNQLIIPADIAKLNKQEIDKLLSTLPSQHNVVIAESKDGGTNALLCSPPNAIQFCFGKNSAKKHVIAAHQAQCAVQIHHLPDLSNDIDLPQDIVDQDLQIPSNQELDQLCLA